MKQRLSISYGKNICQHLKAIRRSIAEENGISLEIPECTYQGPCSGTCPRCEAEVRYLEEEIARRLSVGKVATVAGLALTLSAPAMAQTDTPQQGKPSLDATLPMDMDSVASYRRPTQGVIPVGREIPDSIAAVGYSTVVGTVKDDRTGEPVPFADVQFLKEGALYKSAKTDLDGCYVIRSMPNGDWTLSVSTVGYQTKREEVRIQSNTSRYQLDISLASDGRDCGLSKDTTTPVIDIGYTGAMTIKPEDVEAVIGGINRIMLPGTRAAESGDDRYQRPNIKIDNQ